MAKNRQARNWDDARARHADKMCCRVCYEQDGIELHHIVPREHDVPQTGNDAPTDIRWVHPLAVIPLCRAHHEAAHQHKLDLLPVTTYAEQGHAASVLGLVGAYKKLTGQKEVAA